jgi:hypothetical protein
MTIKQRTTMEENNNYGGGGNLSFKGSPERVCASSARVQNAEMFSN